MAAPFVLMRFAMAITKNKVIFGIFLSFLLPLLIPVISKASADEYILSGEINEQLDIPSGTARVILDGVKGNGDCVIVIPNEAEVVIADGTKNSIGAIQGQGFITVTGGGDLSVEKTIFNMGAGIDFRHTGIISVENGSIIAVGNDISFYTGEVTINSNEDIDSGLFILSGNALIYGGKLTINAVKNGIDIQNGFTMFGGDLYITSEKASAIVVANSGEGEVVFEEGVTVNDEFDTITAADDYGNTRKILMTSDRKQARLVEAHGSPVEFTEPSDSEVSKESLGSDNNSGNRGIIIAVAVIALILILIGILIFVLIKRRKNENHRH